MTTNMDRECYTLSGSDGRLGLCPARLQTGSVFSAGWFSFSRSQFLHLWNGEYILDLLDGLVHDFKMWYIQMRRPGILQLLNEEACIWPRNGTLCGVPILYMIDRMWEHHTLFSESSVSFVYHWKKKAWNQLLWCWICRILPMVVCNFLRGL